MKRSETAAARNVPANKLLSFLQNVAFNEVKNGLGKKEIRRKKQLGYNGGRGKRRSARVVLQTRKKRVCFLTAFAELVEIATKKERK